MFATCAVTRYTKSILGGESLSMKFKPSAKLPDTTPWSTETIGTTLADLGWHGASLKRGLLRIHNAQTGPEATKELHEAFTDQAQGLIVFATDWQSRHFAAGTLPNGQTAVWEADISTGLLEPIATVTDFLTLITTDRKAPKLFNETLFGRFCAQNRLLGLEFQQCASYKVPPMLGGNEDLDNRDLTYNTVHWTMFGQIYQKVKDLPDGTPITEITTE